MTGPAALAVIVAAVCGRGAFIQFPVNGIAVVQSRKVDVLHTRPDKVA